MIGQLIALLVVVGLILFLQRERRIYNDHFNRRVPPRGVRRG